MPWIHSLEELEELEELGAIPSTPRWRACSTVAGLLAALLVLLAVLSLLVGISLRKRARALPLLEGDRVESDAGFVVVAGPGVTVPEATRRAAAAHARAGGLELLDLLPARASAWRLVKALFGVRERALFTSFASGGFAFLAAESLVARAALGTEPPSSAAGMVAAAARLGMFTRASGHAIADLGLGEAADDDRARLGLVAAAFDDLAGVVLGSSALLYALVIASLAVHPIAGGICLASLHLQPLIALGGRFRPADLARTVLLRSLVELGVVLRLALTWRADDEPAAIAERRRRYAGVDPAALFEPRRDDCPQCGARELDWFLDCDDIVQQKPGDFTLERCSVCRHIFQNPRLSPAGLSYYYADVYDGLGAERAARAFGVLTRAYQQRARAVEGLASPRRWLDVGCSGGQFAAVVRSLFPGVAVEGVDLSDVLDDAVRRGWLERAYRGFFPALAPGLGRFDVVSMGHYLEHTTEPAAEIAAAREVLDDGGLLLIEVPDPECRTGRLLGPHWFSWFQPQHLRFLTLANLEALLAEHGFVPLRVERGNAHFPHDFFLAARALLTRMAPPPRAPWRPPATAGDFVWRTVVVLGGVPLLAGAALLDAALSGLLRRVRGGSNCYRVVAAAPPRASMTG